MGGGRFFEGDFNNLIFEGLGGWGGGVVVVVAAAIIQLSPLYLRGDLVIGVKLFFLLFYP